MGAGGFYPLDNLLLETALRRLGLAGAADADRDLKVTTFMVARLGLAYVDWSQHFE